MKAIPGIRSSVSGFTCTRCDQAYPSLYWFKRDASSGRAFCLECARDLPPSQLEDVVQVPGSDVGKRKDPPGLAEYTEALALGVVEIVLLERADELVQLVSLVEPRLPRLLLSVVIFGTIGAAGGLLARLTGPIAASWSSRTFSYLCRKKDAP